MARPKKAEVTEQLPINSIIQDSYQAPLEIESMPLNSLGDYMRYNAEARRLNKKLKLCRYPIKQCPVELHPKERVTFTRNDQPTNPLPVYLSDDMIHFEMTLKPGQTYELPRYVVDYLCKKGVPEWAWYDNTDGSKETRIKSYAPRFALRTIYAA